MLSYQDQLAAFLPDLILPLCIWREARGESFDAKRGVAWAIRNRASDARNRWPKTLQGVILQPWQFSSFNATDPNSKKFPGLEDAAWHESIQAADSTLPDNIAGAQMYHSYTEAQQALWPHWAKMPAAYPQTAHIGAFRFYRQL